jgi:YD repeat-containing protein
MSTFTYAKGKMTSSVDIREVVTSYEYDGLGNLARIRNDDGAIISEQAKRIGQR